MNPHLSRHWSDLFYQRALAHTGTFRLKDFAQPSEFAFARIWLQELVKRKELHRSVRNGVSWYQWINT